jgi:hypothetical protein
MRRSFPVALACISLFALIHPTSARAATITVFANTPSNTWNQWIDTGIDLLPGDLLQILATGFAATSGVILHGPDGKVVPGSPNPTESLVNSVNVGSLVGMIDFPAGSIPTAPVFNTAGMYLLDDPSISGALFGPGFVGSNFDQVIPAGIFGRLYLGFNDGFDADNTGSYVAEITVTSSVPEPATLTCVAIGLAGAIARRRVATRRSRREP